MRTNLFSNRSSVDRGLRRTKRFGKAAGFPARMGKPRVLAWALLALASVESPHSVSAQQTFLDRRQAQTAAGRNGWFLRRESADGHVLELQRIVNGVPLYYSTVNSRAADTVSTDECLPGGSSGLNLTGSGVELGIWDGGGVRLSHVELAGRVTQVDFPSGLLTHSTHVAGTMIASGVLPEAKGMSPAGTLLAYDWNDDLAELSAAAANGLRVSNHSYGFVTGWYFDSIGGDWYWFGDVTVSPTEDYFFGFYDDAAQAWDQLAYDHPGLLIVKSAGNDRHDGPWPGTGHWAIDPATMDWAWSTTARPWDGNCGLDTLSHQATSKNVLTIGAIGDLGGGYPAPDIDPLWFSSRGPCDDGRIKPDIVANGRSLTSSGAAADDSYAVYSGTSMAAPNVSGSMGLLIEHFRATHPGEPELSAATLKALVIHTADDVSEESFDCDYLGLDCVTGDWGPDYQAGWGLLNTLTAAQTITADVAWPMTISEQVLEEGATFELMVETTVAAAELRATIVWTDPPGTPPPPSLDPPTKMLVDDLDLRIYGSGGETYFPWVLDGANPEAAATRGDNITDNVEQVLFLAPGAGTYTVRVTHKSKLAAGVQPFALVVTSPAGVIADCNANGIPDVQDLSTGRSRDCNGINGRGNGIPDECDVASGASADCNYNFVPDECEYGITCSQCDVLEEQALAGPPIGYTSFGNRVAVSGDVALVGAHGAASGTCGGCGEVYLYHHDGADWNQEQVLSASDGIPNSSFGSSVAVSGDVAIVGARNRNCAAGSSCGAAYVFRSSGSGWIEEQKLTAPDAAADDHFGEAVAIDGNVAVVGSNLDDCAAGSDCGSAYVYRFNGSSWIQEQKLTASDAAGVDLFGSAVSVSGDMAMVGAFYADCAAGADCGAAYVFQYDGSAWAQVQKLTASDGQAGDSFGLAVSVHNQTALIGAPSSDCVGAPYCGSAYLYEYDFGAGEWVERTKFTGPDPADRDRFGGSVSVWGNVAVVGNDGDMCESFDNCGSAFVYRFNGSQWVYQSKISGMSTTSNDEFARSVSVNGETVLVGATGVACPFGEGIDCGAAYIFDLQPLPLPGDCNRNGIPDRQDIEAGSSVDCDGNSFPDECDIASCAYDPVQDDCNGNLVPDGCDLNAGTSKDCNFNYLPDECDLAEGRSLDCNADGLPDECYLPAVEAAKWTAADPYPNDLFGIGLAISGDTAIVTAQEMSRWRGGTAYVYRRNGQTWELRQEIHGTAGHGATDPEALSGPVALDGDVAVLGANWDDHCGGADCGAAYVYRFDGEAWALEQKLTGSDAQPGDAFGVFVAVSGDVIAVAAPDARCADGEYCGAVCVFRFNGSLWVEETRLVQPDASDYDYFGRDIAIDGDVLVVSRLRDPSCTINTDCPTVYVYGFNGSDWVVGQELSPPPHEFGGGGSFGVSLGIKDDVVVVGAPGWISPGLQPDGAAFVYRYNGSAWIYEQQLLTPYREWEDPDGLGRDVAVSGDVIVAGAIFDNCGELVTPYLGAPSITDCGSVHVYRYSPGQLRWIEQAKLAASDESTDGSAGENIYLGYSLAISGNTVLAGAAYKGCPCFPGAWCGAAYLSDISDLPFTGADCNDNGAWDACDIRDGLESDCNGNSVPDDCDVESPQADLNENSRPDDCESPFVGAQPQSQSSCEGGQASFAVTAAGMPPLAYAWRKDDLDIPEATGPSLLIPATSSADAGDYDVVISNSLGAVVSDVARLSVVSFGELQLGGDPTGMLRGRYLSLAPPAVSCSVAMRVTMINLQDPQPPNAGCCPPPDFSAFESASCTAGGEMNSCARWVGPPITALESQDLSGIGSYRTARLQCTPYYYDWGSEGLVHVTGAEIIPSSAYDVEVLGAACMGMESACATVSSAMVITTRRAGDISSPYAPDAPGQPNAIDVTNAVNHFKRLTGASKKISAQIQPNVVDPNADVNALDIGAIVDNLKLKGYPFSGPCICPSAVPCNTTSCSSPAQCTGSYGAGAMCVKTCTSGPNLDLPCNNNSHCGQCAVGSRATYPCDADGDCPGGTCTLGTCGAGFCRDRCGRCN